MRTLFYIVSGCLVFLGIMVIVWGLSSRRSFIPCPTLLAWLVELDNPILRNNSARAIIQHLTLEPGMKVADVGCGPGRLTIPVARRIGPAGEMRALDIQAGMLQRVRVKAQAEGLGNIKYMHGGAGEGEAGTRSV